MNDDARESSSARESYLSPAAFSFFPENQSADSVHSEFGVYLSAQQDNYSGYNGFDADNLPHSPVPDSTHPWEEIQPETSGPTNFEAPAGSQDNSTSRYRCGKCKKSFTGNSSLKRHLDTIHQYGKDYWVCTITTCRKYDIPNFRKDNLKRHCETQHPLVHLSEFGL